MEAPDNPEFWNRAARTRKFTHMLDHARFVDAVSREARILDFGCGQGRLLAELVELGYKNLHGLDSSPEMIRLARERVSGASFAVSDGQPLPDKDASVDAVLLFAVLTCIPDDAAQKRLVAEFKRVLRPGGLLLVSDYPLQSDERNLARYQQFAQELGQYGAFRLPDGAVLRHHRPEWFAQLLDGFVIEETVQRETRTMNGNPAHIVQLWARKG